MHPRLIAEAAGYPGETWPITTGAWLTTHYSAEAIWILDPPRH
ncbi:hypothetical protein [Actinoplanes regularis]|nr:hypothetical protein [Actinoplanes regularis]